ncbi:MAG: type IV pilus modification protein PilV [Gammaproteobacteria bacterium]|nr:MAG: type IV pilus modification protein PilV [Gammaproteobacteria bacterium]
MFVENLFKSGLRGNMKTPGKCRGDTMIEVLITVLILAVSILGVAAMQVTALKNLNSSYTSSMAWMVAEDISERMRANPVAVLAGDYEHSSSAAPESYPDCALSACSSADLADYDIAAWWVIMSNTLPSPRGEIARVGGTNTFEVTIRWDDDRSGSTGINCPILSASDLECYQFNVSL